MIYINIGHIGKTFGTKGQLRYNFEEGYDQSNFDNGFIFLNLQGSYVPFKIINHNEESATLKLEWVNTPEEAAKFAHQSFFIPATKGTLDVSEKQLTQLKLLDEDGLDCGMIQQIEDFPSQKMMIVQKDNEEFLIPFHTDLIVEINDDQVIYKVPEGIFDLN